ncbi:GEVED domain-containing protein [Salibacteraceae bacterium]|nr:GEVED domain-containing protein [Salibacteraceae bacterium]
MWVDWNNNGNFAQAGEEVYRSGNLSRTTTYNTTRTITIPSTAATGKLRMRIGTGYFSSGYLKYCGGSYNTEHEDYTVYVAPPKARDAELSDLAPRLICAGLQDINVRVTNRGSDSLASIVLRGNIGTTTFGPTTFSGLNVKNDKDTVLKLGTFTFTSGTAYNMQFSSNSPNGATDLKTSNDTLTINGYKTSLSGTYTVGGSSPDYATPALALTALMANGVCGPVTFNVRSGTYTGQLDFSSAIPGASSTNSVRFRADPANTSAATIRNGSGYTIGFGGGASFISFDSLSISTTSSTRVISLYGNNDSISFDGNKITGYNTTSNSDLYAAVYDANGNNTTNLEFINNEVNYGSYGIRLYGSGSSVAQNQDGFMIKNNKFTNLGYYGIYLYYVKNGTFEGNEVSNISTISQGYGIYGFYNNGVNLVGNKIITYGSSWSRNIYWYRCYGTSTKRTLVANNMFIRPQAGSNSSYYDYFYYCNYIDVVHNSWDGKCNYNSTSYGLIRWYYGTAAQFSNNSLDNNGGTGYTMRVYGTITEKNNNYYSSNTTRRRYPTTGGTGNISVDPGYTSTTDLHISTPALDKKGTALTIVTTDFDGDTRSTTTPDIGADEELFANVDASPIEVVVPASCPGVVVYKAKIKNTGLNALTSFTVNWQVATNSGTPSVKSPVSWTGTLASNAEVTVTLGNVSMAKGSTYNVQLRTSNPNATTDGKTSNDTLNAVKETSMSGTYTVGGLSPDFATPTAALQELNRVGVCGPTELLIRPGTYVGQLKMEEIDGASATNTITWRGTSNTNTTISFVPSGAQYAVIDLNGADYVKFTNLNIHCNITNWNYAKNFRLYNNADHITIDSCIIQQNDNTYNQATGIAVSNSPTTITSGQRCHDLVITNNTIKGMDFGVGYQGQNTTTLGNKLLIENNTFSKIDARAISVYYADSVTIKSNTLTNDVAWGIGFWYNNNYEISKNNVAAKTSYGLYMYRCNYYSATSSNKALVYNNFFSTGGTGRAVYAYECNYLNFYHNSCRAKSSYAFYDYYGSTKKVQNNIFYSETNYAWYSVSTSTTYLNKLDNNLYHRDNSTLTAYFGGGRTLAAWQTAYTAFNANSAEGDPKFVSTGDLHIANGKPADSLGASGLGITMDIDGATRSTTHPDAGAHEYDYQPIDGHLVALTRPSGLCLSATDTVEFAVVNVGGDTIDMATNGVSIAWQVTGPNTASGTDAINVGKLAPGDTVLVKAVGSVVNLSTAGKYTISAYITSSWDRYNENDTLVEQLDRIATESIVAVRDTTVYYKDSLDVTAESALGRTVVVLSEMCQYNATTGSPSGGRPSYLTSDDYVELSTGKGNVDLSGYILEMYSSNSATPTITATLPAGAATNSSGTLIIGGGTGTSVANAYYALGHSTNNWSSSTPVGYILRDPSGKIVDAAAANSAIFNAATGVTSADWSGNVAGSGSTHGIRRNGPDNNTATGWIRTQSVTGQRQDPNTLNAGMNLKSEGPRAFKWTYNGSFYDSLSTTQAGPWTAKGTKEYIASFVSPCSGDTIRDTASIVAFEKNLVTSGNSTEYYSYPLSQTSGIEYSGELNNYGDAMTSVRANVTLDGAAAGDTLVSNSMVRNASGNFTIPNTATVTTTGNKSIKYYYTATTGDDFISDDSANAIVNVSDTVMARENGVLPVSLPASGMTGLGQRFTVFNQDSVTGAQAYIKTAFAGDKFKLVLYNLNGNTVGSKINESGDITLQSMADTGWKKIRFKCLSVLDAGDYLLALELTSSVFSSEVGANHVNATPNSGFVYNGTTWNTTLVNGKQFNSGLRLEFGSYDFPTFAVIDPACISGDTFALSGGLPTGGSYFGTGVSSNSLDPTALTVGSNTVYYTVDNIYGCPDTIGSTIEVKGDPVVSSTFTQLTSCVSANAAISVSATGAFGTLSYSINNGSSFQSTGTFNSIGSGSYTIVVEDSVCSVTDTTYVAAPPGAPNKPSASGGSTYCKGDALSNLNVSTNTSGTAGIFKWYKDGSLTSNHGTGSTIAPTDTVMTQIYYVIEDRLGCVSVADTTVVTINALPNVNISSLSARCTNADSVVLTNGTPTGGSYSGTGISSGVFKPSVAGSGSHVLTYSYTDANTCTDNDTVSVTVHQAPVATYSVLDSACTNTPTYALSGGAPSGGTYSGFGVSGGNFNPGTAGLGSHAISYKVSNTNCSDSASINIRVNLAPTVTTTSISAKCNNEDSLVLAFGSPTGGTYSGTGVSSGSFNPKTAGLGNKVLTYSYTDGNSCSDFDTIHVTVLAAPVVTFAALDSQCTNRSTYMLTGGSPTGGTYSGLGVSSNMFSAGTAGAGLHSILYKVISTNTCTDSASSNVRVHTAPTATFSVITDRCVDASPLALTGGAPTGGTYSGPGVSGTNFTPSVAGHGSHTLKYVYTDNNNCADSATTTSQVDSLPVASFSTLSALCGNNDSITLTQGSASPSGGTGTYMGTGVTGTTFSPAASGTGSFNLSYAYVDANGCRDTAMAVQVVDTVPIVTWAATLADVCIDLVPFAYTSVSPVGGVFKGPGIQTSGMFKADSAGGGMHTINYVFTDGNMCMDSVTNTQWVDTLPTVNFTLPANWCLNAMAISLNSGMPSGGAYTVNGTTDTIYSSTTAGRDTLIYTYSDTNNCVNTATAYIQADTVPVVSFDTIADACVGSAMITLSQGKPLGGMYTGNNVSTGMYNPDTVRTDTLNYTFTDLNGCKDIATQTVTVNALPVVTFSSISGVCANSGMLAITNGAPTGGTYSGVGLNGSTFDPSGVAVGVDTLTYTYIDANNCTDSAKQSIEVYAAPTASMSPIGESCDNGDTIHLNMGMPAGGTYIGLGVDTNVIIPNTSLIGVNTVSYIATNTNCSDTAMANYTIVPSPLFNVVGKLEGCKNDTLTLTTSDTSGFVHNWSNGDTTNSINVSTSGMIWVQVTDTTNALGCNNYDTVDVKLEGECVGIDPTLSVNDIRYYPNPNNGNFNYEISGLNGNSAQLRIFSSNGQEVYFTEFTNMAEKETGEIMLDNMEQGVYYIQLNSSIGSAVHRIVINR